MKKNYPYMATVILLFFCYCSSLAADDTDSLSIDDLLNMSLSELMNVKVTTAGKKPEIISEIPASVVIITREEIEKRGYVTYMDIFRNIPGFYMIDDYFWLGTKNYGVRGFFSTGTFNDVIIMVNGVNQMGDSYNDYPDSKINVPVEAIDRIEVIRGPMSVMYGSGAFMGAINIITNEVYDDKKNSVYTSYGSHNTYRVFAGLSDKNDDFRYSFNTSFSRSNGLDAAFSEMADSAVLDDYQLKSDATTEGLLSDRRFYLNLNTSYHNLTFDVSYSSTRQGVFDGMPSLGSGTNINVNATNAQLKYQADIKKDLKITGKASYFNHNFFWEYEQLKPNSYSTNNSSTNAFEVELNLSYLPTEELDILGGFYHRTLTNFYKTYDYPIFSKEYTNTELYIPNDDHVTTMAVYTQLHYHILENLLFFAGARLESYSDYDMVYSLANETFSHEIINGRFNYDKLNVIPRLAAIYKINDENVFKAMYGEAIKQPSINETFSQLVSGKPYLDPAEISTLEVNYIFSGVSNTVINFSTFMNAIDNLIVKRNIYNDEMNKWELYSLNRGKMSTHGVELNIITRPFKNFSLDLSGTYQQSYNDEPGYGDIDLGYAPRFLGYAKFAYDINKYAIVSINGRYIGKMETFWNNDPIDPEGGDLTPIGRIGEAVDGYLVTDFNFRLKDIFFDGMVLNMHVMNIFDTEVRYPTTKSNEWAKYGTLGFRRSFLLSAGMEF